MNRNRIRASRLALLLLAGAASDAALAQDAERGTRYVTTDPVASVFYAYFVALGYEIAVDESSSHGRLDLAVRTGGHVYLFEFKVVEMAPPGSALAQLRERGYAAKYRDGSEPIHLIGVEFSRATRNVTTFEVADC